jgi:hypothetical protein
MPASGDGWEDPGGVIRHAWWNRGALALKSEAPIEGASLVVAFGETEAKTWRGVRRHAGRSRVGAVAGRVS